MYLLNIVVIQKHLYCTKATYCVPLNNNPYAFNEKKRKRKRKKLYYTKKQSTPDRYLRQQNPGVA